MSPHPVYRRIVSCSFREPFNFTQYRKVRLDGAAKITLGSRYSASTNRSPVDGRKTGGNGPVTPLR